MIRTLEGEDDLEALLHEDVAVVYKHSPACFISLLARRQVDRFADHAPDTPIVLVDVVGDRPLSAWIAERLGVRHESPQVIVLSEGRVVFDASHARVRASVLRGVFDVLSREAGNGVRP